MQKTLTEVVELLKDSKTKDIFMPLVYFVYEKEVAKFFATK